MLTITASPVLKSLKRLLNYKTPLDGFLSSNGVFFLTTNLFQKFFTFIINCDIK